jgi:hypothetical protein
MKVTAVEFLIEELNNIKSSSTDQYGKITFLEKEFIRVLEQAKEMEKEQKGYSDEDLEKAFKVGFTLGYGSDVEAIAEKDKCFNRWFKIFKNKQDYGKI